VVACGLPEWFCELWVCECCFGPDGQAIFHVDRLVDSLYANDQHISSGWHPGYVPFALCKTIEEANEACDRMKRKQKLLADLRHRTKEVANYG
jgi:hypothetical protein